MIKAIALIFFSCLLWTNLVHSSTQIKPPMGPFVSMLRATFAEIKLKTIVPRSVVKGTLETEQKKYSFKVPDLGRYSAKPNVAPADTYQKPNAALSFATMPLNNTQKKPLINKNAFDDLAIEMDNQQGQFSAAYSLKPNVNKTIPNQAIPNQAIPNQAIPNQAIPNQSFDRLAIRRGQNNESGFYPPEWTQAKPLRPINRSPSNYPNNNFFNPNSMMARPFSNQMPTRNPRQQTYNGYR